MKTNVRKFHSEAAKRKASDTAELHTNKVPRLSDEHQTGGAVTTRMKREVHEEDESKQEVKMAKPDSETTKDTNDEYGGGPNPLFGAVVKKLGQAKRWKQNTVVNQKFILTLDQ